MVYGLKNIDLNYELEIIPVHHESSKQILSILPSTNWYHSISSDSKNWGRFGKSKNSYFVEIPDICLSHIHLTTKNVSIINTHNLPQTILRSFFENHLLPFLLSSEGHLIVHAGGWADQRGAFLFIGESHAGKSTLSLQLLNLGVKVIGDDSQRVVVDTAKAYVYPGHPHIRVGHNLPDNLLSQHEVSQSYFHKLVIPLKNQTSNRHPICGILALKTAKEFDIQKMEPEQALPSMLENIFRLDISASKILMNEFKSICQIVLSVPLFEVSWPKDYAQLQENSKKLLDYFAKLPFDN